MPLETDKEFCHKCGKVTLWVANRTGTQLRCDSCGDKFPCKKCEHIDCKQTRTQRSKP